VRSTNCYKNNNNKRKRNKMPHKILQLRSCYKHKWQKHNVRHKKCNLASNLTVKKCNLTINKNFKRCKRRLQTSNLNLNKMT